MVSIKALNKWANSHTSLPIDILRIMLGVFLFMKGVYFMQHFDVLGRLLEPFEKIIGDIFLLNLIIPAHFVGGIMIVFGLLTRWVMVLEIPLLIGAVVINFTGEMNTTNLILASLTLLVCIFFLIYGSGKHSADYYFKMQK